MLISEIKNHVAYITLNRSEIHNAFNDELIEKITQTFIDLEKNESVRLVVLSGAGKSFCAGADLNWMKSMKDYSMEENKKDSIKLYTMFSTINHFSKPVIGKVNGHALGGGLGLVSVCDYVLTHEKAKFGFTEVKLGLIPAVISPFCIRKIGETHARAWFMSGELFNASKAMQIGLVHEVCELENFEKRSQEVVELFLKAGPKAAVSAKELIENVINLEDEMDYVCDAIAKQRVSSEGQEGMSALLEKRNAKWMDK